MHNVNVHFQEPLCEADVHEVNRTPVDHDNHPIHEHCDFGQDVQTSQNNRSAWNIGILRVHMSQ